MLGAKHQFSVKTDGAKHTKINTYADSFSQIVTFGNADRIIMYVKLTTYLAAYNLFQ